MNLQKKSKTFGDKRFWRESMKASLIQQSQRLSAAALRDLQDRVCAHLISYLKNQKGSWAGFQSLPGEPDLGKVYQQTPHLQWSFPRIEGTDLHFHTCENFVSGTFGILEPSKEDPAVACESLAGVLVPGLGFNKKGRRLGRGRGFYDRALAEYRGFKVGVCFDCQVVDEDLPEESHDISVDALVTETAFIIVNAG